MAGGAFGVAIVILLGEKCARAGAVVSGHLLQGK